MLVGKIWKNEAGTRRETGGGEIRRVGALFGVFAFRLLLSGADSEIPRRCSPGHLEMITLK